MRGAAAAAALAAPAGAATPAQAPAPVSIHQMLSCGEVCGHHHHHHHCPATCLCCTPAHGVHTYRMMTCGGIGGDCATPPVTPPPATPSPKAPRPAVGWTVRTEYCQNGCQGAFFNPPNYQSNCVYDLDTDGHEVFDVYVPHADGTGVTAYYRGYCKSCDPASCDYGRDYKYGVCQNDMAPLPTGRRAPAWRWLARHQHRGGRSPDRYGSTMYEVAGQLPEPVTGSMLVQLCKNMSTCTSCDGIVPCAPYCGEYTMTPTGCQLMEPDYPEDGSVELRCTAAGVSAIAYSSADCTGDGHPMMEIQTGVCLKEEGEYEDTVKLHWCK